MYELNWSVKLPSPLKLNYFLSYDQPISIRPLFLPTENYQFTTTWTSILHPPARISEYTTDIKMASSLSGTSGVYFKYLVNVIVK